MEQLRRARDAAERRRNAVRRDAGSTLIEVVISMVLLGIMSAAVLGIMFASQASSVDSRNRVAASNLAARELDLVREQFLASDTGPVDVANEGVVTNQHPVPDSISAGQPSVIDGTEYTVVRSSTWNVTGTGETACEGGAAVQHPTLIVTVTVTWPNMGSTLPVVNTAALAPERGLGLPTTASFIAVSVVDSKGDPNPGRTVTVSSSSETRSGLTDASGCAVLAVNPPAGGADYVAHFPNAGYVDITGTSNPERDVGTVEQQQLTANVGIALDLAGTLTVRMSGSGLSDAGVAGTVFSLYKSESAGSSITQHSATGVDTVLTNLWPTQYAAFFGTTQPPSFSNLTDLTPGGSAVLLVPYEYARFTVTDLPAAGTVIAVSPGGTCTTPGARTVDPANGSLPPGTWSFFLQSPVFGCAEGPDQESLQPGDNGPMSWGSTTLRLTGAPIGQGAIWAVSNRVSATSCATSNALKLADDGGTVGPVELPSGDWFIYAMADVGGVPAGGTCQDAGLVAVPYGENSVFAWAGSTSTVRVINAPTGSSYRLIATPSPSTTCTRNSVSTSYQTLPASGSAYQGTLAQGTWYLYSWRRTSSGPSNRCSPVGGYPITVAWAPSYTMNWTAGGAVTTP